METDKRIHERYPFASEVRISHESFGSVLVKTRDLSDGGLFLEIEGLEPPELGTIMEAQVQGPMPDMPLVPIRLVRIVDDGWGVEFC